MECTYTIQDGELIRNNGKENIKTVYLMLLLRFLRFLVLVLSFGLIMYLTYIIFRECITEVTLGNCIPLGSIFATFGSAVISVISLYCNRQKFTSNDLDLTIALPTCTADFYDLPIVVGIVKMFRFEKHLSGAVFHLKSLKNIGLKSDLSVFHCTMMIYRNILRYKAGTIIIMIGSEFVLASIIFSFFYKSVSEFILLITT